VQVSAGVRQTLVLAMFKCPHCSERCIPRLAGVVSSSLAPARCPRCAGRSRVSPWLHAAAGSFEVWLVFGVIAAAGSLLRAVAVIALTSAAVFAPLLLVPLRPLPPLNRPAGLPSLRGRYRRSETERETD
jgi:hypothetical protein